MAFRNAQKARIYLAHLALSTYTRNASATSPTDMLDVTTLADTSKAFIPGLTTSTFNADGPLDVDPTANALHDTLADYSANVTTPTPITYLPLGTDGAAWLVEAWNVDLTESATVSGTVDWSLAAQTTGVTDTNGRVLENNTSVTTDTNGTALDNTASTSNGAVLHLHVTAFSGLTSDAITVQQSATGSFGGEETTLATFTTVSAVGSERKVVTGTVARYLRVVDDVTGTGSITRFVAISRR